ncbi:patatin-like phospholipase family protein [Halosegnis sp.]|uniref:patatin-like phospholipase family protein n=1 Tax=Halosegnis sp. TaxID=2864959 RepID=UPI0035D4378F
MREERPTRVAIACQGGGSHTAFTAGVLRGLLAEWDDDDHELVGISGTSGGAFSALMTWYGHVSDEHDARELLDSFWDDLSANGITDHLANNWMVGMKWMENTAFPLPKLSPYQNPGSKLGKKRIRRILERHVDFDEIPALSSHETPELVIGAVNINKGVFETFTNEDVTAKAILASAALPEMFEAVEINGDYYWDGVFSHNPPIDGLMNVPVDKKPEELWVIQINPQEREANPTSLGEILDRRNELFGNISLNQELRSIRRVNEWIERGDLSTRNFTHTTIRKIPLEESYHAATKFDRSKPFIRDLLELGEQQAIDFYEDVEPKHPPLRADGGP